MADALTPDEAALLAAPLAPDGALPRPPPTLDDVRRYLTGRIAELLERRPALLMSLLYRIDVAERDVQQALRAAPPGALPGALADLVLARQLQKLETRRRYAAASPHAAPPDADTTPPDADATPPDAAP